MELERIVRSSYAAAIRASSRTLARLVERRALDFLLMSQFTVKTYVVQKADRDGNLYGPPLAVKLTFEAAHNIAKKHAPAKVTPVMADKSAGENGPDYVTYHPLKR